MLMLTGSSNFATVPLVSKCHYYNIYPSFKSSLGTWSSMASNSKYTENRNGWTSQTTETNLHQSIICSTQQYNQGASFCQNWVFAEWNHSCQRAGPPSLIFGYLLSLFQGEGFRCHFSGSFQKSYFCESLKEGCQNNPMKYVCQFQDHFSSSSTQEACPLLQWDWTMWPFSQYHEEQPYLLKAQY